MLVAVFASALVHGFDQLAKRYDWLRGMSEDRMFPYEIKPLGVVDAPAAKAGSVTAWFHQWGDGQLVLRDAKEEIVVGLLYVDRDGELRWARRIYG